VVKHTGAKELMRAGLDVWYHEEAAKVSDQCAPEEMGAEDPLFILYTSGSTGKPKGAVHGHAGFPVKVQIDAYSEGRIGALYIVYTRFINTMKQEPVIEQLLPLSAEQFERKDGEDKTTPSSAWDYIYEPDAQTVVDELLVRYVEALVYQAVAENMASEQSARMVAMKAASDNAKTVISELQLVYNKSRQAAITKELSEIVGGAAAV